MAGVPFVFLASFLGAMLAAILVRAIARTGAVILPGALLLSGVVVNLVSLAAVLTIQYRGRPEQLPRNPSLDGRQPRRHRYRPRRVICWCCCAGVDRAPRPLAKLNLLAIDEDTAATLGVNVRQCETIVHALCSLIVGVTVAMGGAIGFVGLIVPHAVR